MRDIGDITFEEYREWKRGWAQRLDRIKESDMNARARLNELKDISTTGRQLDELVVLAADAQLIRSTYQTLNVEVPEFVDEANRTLIGEIAQRNRDALEARLRELKQADSALMSRDEKRAENAKQIERLEQALGRKTAEPVGVSS